MTQPEVQYLIDKTGITLPLIGLYDTPDKSLFDELHKSDTCIFANYKKWGKGGFTLVTREQYGCPGAGTWLCNVKTKSREDYIKFLVDDEGLKANHELMGKWLDYVQPYRQQHDYLVIGPLNKKAYEYLKTVTFFVNPDQLSMLMIGAQLFSAPHDPEPVLAPFGSGCMQLISLFNDLEAPQAIVGATDMAMRKYIPYDILAFTVTKPLFNQLSSIGKGSYLGKRFIKDLKKSRKLSKLPSGRYPRKRID